MNASYHPSKNKPKFLSTEVEQDRTFFCEKARRIDGFTVVCGGREQSVAAYRINRESFPYIGIEWVAAGRGELTLAGKSYSLQPGAFFIYGPGVPHKIKTHATDRLVKYFLDLEGPGAKVLLTKHRLSVPSFRVIPPDAGLLNIFDAMVEAGTSTVKSSVHLCRLLLECIVVIAAEKCSWQNVEHGKAYQCYVRCRAYIEHHFRHLQQLSDVALACNVSAAYLVRVFHRFARETPYRFLVRLKMKSAALDLLRRDVLIKEIAYEFGYSDPYHFSKTFKKVHGISPDKFVVSNMRRQLNIAQN